jgi:hypothetical protein
LLEFGAIVRAPPLLRIEKGGLWPGEPTLACRTPGPVLPIVILALAVEFGAARNFRLRWETVM